MKVERRGNNWRLDERRGEFYAAEMGTWLRHARRCRDHGGEAVSSPKRADKTVGSVIGAYMSAVLIARTRMAGWSRMFRTGRRNPRAQCYSSARRGSGEDSADHVGPTRE